MKFKYCVFDHIEINVRLNYSIVCLFVCFVGLFHIGNWNFRLVMA